MHLKVSNVNEAFRTLVDGFHTGTIPTRHSPSRNGGVMVVDEPVTITYERPWERVLFNRARDCNPFFHLFEALWMLAGSREVVPLAYYNSGISRYSDDGETLNDAYGYRWRRHTTDLYDDTIGPDPKEVDQLKVLIDHFKRHLDTRRAVLQMWNVEDDLLKIDSSKSVCCNTAVYFLLRTVSVKGLLHYHLDMTVVNRSNDLIWGTLGSDCVCFSLLQEYAAAAIGVQVGRYHQVTNNLHAYIERWTPQEWLNDDTPDCYTKPTGGAEVLVPLVKDVEAFDREVREFVDNPHRIGWLEPFFDDVAVPMCLAFKCHKERRYDVALKTLCHVKADDWRRAATDWITKRQHNWEARQSH